MAGERLTPSTVLGHAAPVVGDFKAEATVVAPHHLDANPAGGGVLGHVHEQLAQQRVPPIQPRRAASGEV